MKISFQIEFDENSTGGVLMAEEWIKGLVNHIKQADHQAAEAALRREERLRTIATEGGPLWRSFGDFLEKYIKEMEREFGNDITRGTFSFSRDATTGGIAFSKSLYPFVQCTLTPDYAQGTVSISYHRQNPGPPIGGYENSTMPGRFEVQEGRVILQLDGRPWQQPQEAAQFIVLKLFVPDETPTRRIVLDEK